MNFMNSMDKSMVSKQCVMSMDIMLNTLDSFCEAIIAQPVNVRC